MKKHLWRSQSTFVMPHCYEKLFSFLIDFVIVLGLTFATFLCFLLFSPEVGELTTFLSSLAFLKAFFILFSVYFLTYFSFLDLNATPGKLLFGLKLVGMNGGHLSFKQTLLRSIITLSSFLVAFFAIDRRLSWKVVRFQVGKK